MRATFRFRSIVHGCAEARFGDVTRGALARRRDTRRQFRLTRSFQLRRWRLAVRWRLRRFDDGDAVAFVTRYARDFETRQLEILQFDERVLLDHSRLVGDVEVREVGNLYRRYRGLLLLLVL